MFRRFIRVTRMSETSREIGKKHESVNKAFGHLGKYQSASSKCEEKYKLLQHTVNNHFHVICVKEEYDTKLKS